MVCFNWYPKFYPNCRKFIKFLSLKINLVGWCHVTTILKGDLIIVNYLCWYQTFFFLQKTVYIPKKKIIVGEDTNLTCRRKVWYIWFKIRFFFSYTNFKHPIKKSLNDRIRVPHKLMSLFFWNHVNWWVWIARVMVCSIWWYISSVIFNFLLLSKIFCNLVS